MTFKTWPLHDGMDSFWRSMLDPALSYKSNASIQTGLHFFYFSINCLSGVRYNSEEKVWRQVHYIANLRCTVHVDKAKLRLYYLGLLVWLHKNLINTILTGRMHLHGILSKVLSNFYSSTILDPIAFHCIGKKLNHSSEYVFHRRKLQVWWKYMKLSKWPFSFLGDLSL